MLRAALIALLLACVPQARAESLDRPTSQEHLTSRGRFMLTGNLGGFYSTDDSIGHGAKWRWGIHVGPGLTYFFRDRMGAGIFTSFGYRKADQLFDIDETDGGVGVRMMFDVPLTDRLSLFFWPWISYNWAVRDERRASLSLGAGSTTLRTEQKLRYAQAALFLPLLFHVTQNLGIGLGPQIYVDFAIQREVERDPDPSVGLGGGPVPFDPYAAERSYRVTTGLMSTIVGSF